MLVIGIDGGLAAFGVAVVEPVERKVLRAEVWRTAPDKSKRNIRKADDVSDRSREIARRLLELVSPDVVALCVEATALPFRRAQLSVVSNLGRIRGLVDCVAALHSLPIIEETPQRLKKMLTGKADSSKEEMIRAIEARFPGVEKLWPTQKTLVEHAADAVAAAYAGLESDIVRGMVRAFKMPPIAMALGPNAPTPAEFAAQMYARGAGPA